MDTKNSTFRQWEQWCHLDGKYDDSQNTERYAENTCQDTTEQENPTNKVGRARGVARQPSGAQTSAKPQTTQSTHVESTTSIVVTPLYNEHSTNGEIHTPETQTQERSLHGRWREIQRKTVFERQDTCRKRNKRTKQRKGNGTGALLRQGTKPTSELQTNKRYWRCKSSHRWQLINETNED